MKRTYAYFDDNGKKVGEIAYGYGPRMTYKGEYGEVIDIAKIKSDVPGTGVGARVVEALKREADQRGARLVVDWVEPGSVGFWQMMGFKVADPDLRPAIEILKENSNWNTYAIYRGQKSSPSIPKKLDEAKRLTNPTQLERAKDYEAVPADATPDTVITIYRAAREPIAPGQHVTTIEGNAKRYSPLRKNAPIQKMEVPLKDLVQAKGRGSEFVYSPKAS